MFLEWCQQFFGEHASTLVAFVALWVAAFNYHSTRKHNCLSCRPHLDLWLDQSLRDRRQFLRLDLTNKGIGPARILGIEVFVNDELIQSTAPIESALKRLITVADPQVELDFKTAHMKPGFCVAVGESLCLFDFETPDPDPRWADVLHQARIRISYESFYAEEMPVCDSRDSNL